jgi:hypothetical protein
VLYLSTVLGRRVQDDSGFSLGRIADLVSHLEASMAPRIIAVLIRSLRQEWRIPVDCVHELEARRPIVLSEFGALAQAHLRPGEIRLGHDLLDRQVIDLRERTVARVNEVRLEITGRLWIVQGVDTGLRALINRLLPRVLRRACDDSHFLCWDDMELLVPSTANRQLSLEHKGLARLNPVEIACIADAVLPPEAMAIIASLHNELAAEVLEAMIDSHRAEVLAGLDPKRAITLLQLMTPNVAADMLDALEQDAIYRKLPVWQTKFHP